VSQIRVDSEDPDKVIISLRSGGIYKSIDGATNWTEITNNLPERNIRSLDISRQNSDVIYAGTRFYGVYKSINGGTSWNQVLAPLLTVVPDEVNSLFGAVAVHPTNADIVMVADWWSGIYLTTDGGISWDLLNTDLSTRIVKDIEFSADGKFVYAGTTGEGVFRMQYSTEALLDRSSEALSFGSVNVTEGGSESFNLSNYGNASLSITGFNFSGTGFTVSNSPSTIAAGANVDVTVNFTPTDEVNYDQTLTVQTSIGDFVFDLSGDGEYLVCSEDLLITGESSVCGVASTTFDAGTGFDTYQWFKDGTAIDGATSQTYSSDVSGSFTVRVVNTGACAKLSAAHVYTVNDLPGTQISVSGANLTAPSGATYQWFRDGNEISGETNRTFRAVDSGVYTVEVTSSQGCAVLSEPVTATPILESGINTKNLALVYPNPSNGIFKIQFPNPNGIRHELNLVDSEGKSHWAKENFRGSEVAINRPNLSKGIYLMQITNAKGAKYTVKLLVIK
jgi:type IX secretion system substrate protein/HYDIN/CFA65/VesB family protein